MTVYKVDPLRDPRWPELLQRHPRASVFHTPGWLEALRRTYGYEPVAYTTSDPGAELTNGIVFCWVRSWLTGRRLVSLPFSDHCGPLVSCQEEFERILSELESGVGIGGASYIEVRPTDVTIERAMWAPEEAYILHRLDLRPSLEELHNGFHHSSTRRKIRRAECEGLTYQEGRSEFFVKAFYRLWLLTRRRHRLPPQPYQWFRNLAECMGDSLKIRLALNRGQPIASILTLTHRKVITYKYGCSDARFNNMGGMHFLFWKTIQEGKQLGLLEMDLGRSETNNAGLITFKDRWGATQSSLNYFRYPRTIPKRQGGSWKLRLVRQTASFAPDGLLKMIGRILYKHIG